MLHPDLGCASYVIADTSAGVGAVVDPKWDIAEYLALAADHDFRITDVIETHNHADHLSGRPRLVAATGARSWVHPLADAGYPHEPFADGAEIDLRRGASAGHAHARPPARAHRRRGDRPLPVRRALRRPHRRQPVRATMSPAPTWPSRSARAPPSSTAAVQRLLELGDGVEVFPGHTGGSLCGSARMSETTSSTIGYERASNPMLQLAERGAVRRRAGRGAAAAAAELRGHRRGQPARRRRPDRGSGAAARPTCWPIGSPPARSSSTAAPPEHYDGGHIPAASALTYRSTGSAPGWPGLLSRARSCCWSSSDDDEAREMAQLLRSRRPRRHRRAGRRHRRLDRARDGCWRASRRWRRRTWPPLPLPRRAADPGRARGARVGRRRISPAPRTCPTTILLA